MTNLPIILFSRKLLILMNQKIRAGIVQKPFFFFKLKKLQEIADFQKKSRKYFKKIKMRELDNFLRCTHSDKNVFTSEVFVS